jgi:hypothetical protein
MATTDIRDRFYPCCKQNNSKRIAIMPKLAAIPLVVLKIQPKVYFNVARRKIFVGKHNKKDMFLDPRTRKSVPIILVSIFLLLLASSLVFPFSSASASPNSITNVNSNVGAGYRIVSTGTSDSMSISGAWVVPTASSCINSFFVEYDVWILINVPNFEGSSMIISCARSGASPQYSMNYYYQGTPNALSLKDTISPGNKMSAVVTWSSTSGALTIKIKDSTKGWTFSFAGSDTTTGAQIAYWELFGVANSLPFKFTTLKTSGDKATIRGYSGVLGSFVPLTSLPCQCIAVDKVTYFDKVNRHVLAEPSSITSTSSSFAIKWVAFS